MKNELIADSGGMFCRESPTDIYGFTYYSGVLVFEGCMGKCRNRFPGYCDYC